RRLVIAAQPLPHRSGAICRSNVLTVKSISFSRHCSQCRSGYHAAREVIIPQKLSLWYTI
ncbi:MAG: hypothetical protein RR273_03745, partial [Oscillospiraceae bacterium]